MLTAADKLYLKELHSMLSPAQASTNNLDGVHACHEAATYNLFAAVAQLRPRLAPCRPVGAFGRQILTDSCAQKQNT